ncbi:hypothetical protein CDAR_437081 [Caerostris darwini]|uniref:Uncharacterized protein n=1 Tax=Caerostris darwini TaxID=1538125 RepID=A0AAV4TWC2_9ARAC|nr:hypothetical protein CDAR_437081 [Caerostris darwini]
MIQIVWPNQLHTKTNEQLKPFKNPTSPSSRNSHSSQPKIRTSRVRGNPPADIEQTKVQHSSLVAVNKEQHSRVCLSIRIDTPTPRNRYREKGDGWVPRVEAPPADGGALKALYQRDGVFYGFGIRESITAMHKAAGPRRTWGRGRTNKSTEARFMRDGRLHMQFPSTFPQENFTPLFFGGNKIVP